MNALEVAAKIGQGSEKRVGQSWRMSCPAHHDPSPSLDVSEGREGRVLVICRAGCELDAVLIAAGLDWNDLFVEDSKDAIPDDEWSPAGRIIDKYDYVDEGGKLLFQVVRAEGKKFLQRRPEAMSKSGWVWKLGDVRRPLYRLPEVIDAISHGLTVFVCEGEKDVDAVRRTGAVATCSPHGAGKWREEHTEALRDAAVVVVADRDEPGYKHARAVVKALTGVAAGVLLTQPAEGKDVFDHLLAGLTLDDLTVMTPEEAQPLMAQDVLDFIQGESEYDWVVKGLLERGDRLMLTGFEGFGKTTLMRQMAICFAAGIHPFRHQPMSPVRVLMVDLENGSRLTRRRFNTLLKAAADAGHPVARDQFYVMSRPEGVDLTSFDDSEWLYEQVTAFKPDVVFVGPLYQLHFEDPNSEQSARLVAQVLRNVTVRGNCALITEAHAGKGVGGAGKRHLRPIGASLWMRWPEFGYGLDPTDHASTVKFTGWRGPRDEREWPDRLERSSPWPWRGVYGTAPKVPAPTPAAKVIDTRDFSEPTVREMSF